MEFTTKVIDLAKLTPEQVKVVCSVSGDNGENNQRKLGKDYPIGQPSDPVKKINFYTSTCFEGCDIYDENGVTFIVSDGNKSHTLLDISTLFTQICGRLRDSKYNIKTWLYSSIKPSRIKYLFIKDIIALIPVISFAVIDIITPDKPHLIIRYAVCIFIYILILATYHWVINIFKIIPYVKYRDLLKIIDAEIEEAPMTFEK